MALQSDSRGLCIPALGPWAAASPSPHCRSRPLYYVVRRTKRCAIQGKTSSSFTRVAHVMRRCTWVLQAGADSRRHVDSADQMSMTAALGVPISVQIDRATGFAVPIRLLVHAFQQGLRISALFPCRIDPRTRATCFIEHYRVWYL
jgi:hypothetical protein